MSRKILITGASGLIGSHLIDTLKKTSVYNIIKGVDTTKALPSKYADINNLKMYNINILDQKKFEPLMEDIDVVYHCAGEITFKNDRKNTMYKNNTIATRKIVNLCLKYKVSKLVYISTALLFSNINSSKNNLIAEQEFELNSTNLDYIQTKYLAELEVKRGIQEGLNSIILYPTYVLGSESSKSYSSNLIFESIKYNISPNGSYGAVGIHDLIKLMIDLMESKIKNDTFIINSENITFKELLEKVATLSKEHKKLIPLTRSRYKWALFRDRLGSNKNKILSYNFIELLEKSIYLDNTKILKVFPKFKFMPVNKILSNYINELSRKKIIP